MKTQKLSLTKIKIESFIPSLKKDQWKTINGGVKNETNNGGSGISDCFVCTKLIAIPDFNA